MLSLIALDIKDDDALRPTRAETCRYTPLASYLAIHGQNVCRDCARSEDFSGRGVETTRNSIDLRLFIGAVGRRGSTLTTGTSAIGRPAAFVTGYQASPTSSTSRLFHLVSADLISGR